MVALKYTGWRHLARVCAERIRPQLVGEEIDALVPVPLHPARLRERGFNQALEIAVSLSDLLDTPVVESVQRVVATRPQVGLGRKQREANVADAFRIDATIAPGTTIALIDDVTTSGATLASAARTLLAAGATRVIGATFALATDRGHG